MAVKHIIAQGIGFAPGSTRYIPTLGFLAGALVVPSPMPVVVGQTPQVLLPKRTGLIVESAIRLKPSGRVYGPHVVLPKRTGLTRETAIQLKPGGRREQPEPHPH